MKLPGRALSTLLSLELLGCGPEPGVSVSDTDSASSTIETAATGQTQNTAPTTTAADTTSTSACDMVSASTTSTWTTSTASTTNTVCSDPSAQPNNSSCTDPSGCGCGSGKCFFIPTAGGICGECLGDADCPDGGCTIPNPVTKLGSTCNNGGPGDGCMSDAVCKDPAALKCGVVLSIPGIINVSTCGACRSNADCEDPKQHNCTPEYILGKFTGQLTCKGDGAISNNSGCSLAGCMGERLGNGACASNFCGQAIAVDGALKLGVCGECNAESDCGSGKQCTLPSADVQSGVLSGSTCI